MTPAQAVALVFADDTALNLSAFTPHPAVTEAPYAVVSSRDEDDGQPIEMEKSSECH